MDEKTYTPYLHTAYVDERLDTKVQIMDNHIKNDN